MLEVRNQEPKKLNVSMEDKEKEGEGERGGEKWEKWEGAMGKT
jgi:hypothetical protein